MMIVQHFPKMVFAGHKIPEIVGYYDPDKFPEEGGPITWSVMLVPKFTFDDDEIDFD